MFKQSDIKVRMNVIATDDAVMGMVDELEGGSNTIRLSRDIASQVHHWIDLTWVKKVDVKGVHLTKSAEEVLQGWQSNPPSAPK